MITKENFPQVLSRLGFTKSKKNVYRKDFPEIDAFLKVDFDKEKLVYPISKGFIISGDFTTSFTQKENFVVFECVHRLFEKGYKPKHIELEPKWTVGHGASGGRADIMVKDNSGKSLLIIECKTAGREYEEEWKKTLVNGGQIITYGKQAGSTKFVCLYTSDWLDEKLFYQNYVITLQDNKKLLEELIDKEPLSYEVAKGLDKEDIFKAWKETYSQDFATKGIFETDIPAYYIGKTKYSTQDLNVISSKDIQGKYHEFASILRQHNVSGRENAFDKLVNLFLCKIVDETNNPTELKFYWKGIAYDSFFDLQDRLQKLYQDGMKRFLGEDVTYIDNEAIDNAFRFLKKDPDATRDTIKKYFRELKFFTNNDFAFIDVHNEKLFYQNSHVLLKMVLMLQDIKLKTEEQNQFLGDMFEGFLDQGVKQSEGQFFTPMPMVKFILNSLPLEQIIIQSEQVPKVIDYACGAGHFLNEYAQQIEPIVKANKDIDVTEYHKRIDGIEKEYRLSKVAKVSAFMYGQDNINIIHADALARTASIKENSYSLLVANPPYSVKGYLETLSGADLKNFELIQTINSKSYASNNSIEAFFIERAKQLLKSDGIGAIIVPSSILSKGSNSSTSKGKNIYVVNREILLKFFDIIAIAEFGSGTFGKTGTNTVTLFLKRKKSDPAPADHFYNRVEDWFKGGKKKNKVYQDEHYIKKYCNHLEIDFAEYETLLKGTPSENLLNHEIFIEYKRSFDKWSDIKNRKKQKSFKDLTIKEQKRELQKKLISFTRELEKEKLFFFLLASQNSQKVVIVKSPSKGTEIKNFLGYEWSSAKGNEGIQYIGGVKIDELSSADMGDGEVALEDEDKRVLSNIYNLANIQTPLYDPKTKDNPEKINSIILNNFEGKNIQIDENLKRYVTTSRLIDMLDFKSANFDKTFNLTPEQKVEIESQWDVVRLGDVCEIKIGGTPSRSNSDYFTGSNSWVSISEMNGQVITETKEKITEDAITKSNVKLIPKGTTLLSFKLSIGKTAIAGKDLYTNEAIAGLIPRDNTKILNKYLFHLFDAKLIDLQSVGLNTFGKSLNSSFLKNDVKIPLPPLDKQEEIIAVCEALDIQGQKSKKLVEEKKKEIEEILNETMSKNFPLKKIKEIAEINPSKKELSGLDPGTMISFIEMASVSEKGFISHKEDRRYSQVKKGSYRYFREGDIIVAKITPCMENGKSALATGLTNNIGFGSSEFHVFRCKNEIIGKYLFSFLNRESVRKEAEQNMTGSSGHRRVPEKFYSNLQIPVPKKINEQEKILQSIEKLENEIKEAENLIESLPSKKQEKMKNFL